MATLKNNVFRKLNRIFPKFEQVLVTGSEKVESNAVEIANALIQENRNVYFLVSKNFMPYLRKIIDPRVNLVLNRSFFSYYLFITSKYIFSTHGSSLAGSSKKQQEINIWHGVLYKNIRKLRGEPGIDANITVGTSPLSQKMFSEAFGVPLKSVFISGYPRNDIMIRSQKEKNLIISGIKPNLSGYKNIVFWMPTFRRIANDPSSGQFGMELNNPFQIKDFDIEAFNELLKTQNSFCILKPHYFYMSNTEIKGYSNILMIDDEWIVKQGITLYHLLGCTDVLISDFSSVIIDYILINKPVICFCTDIEEYKRTQGLYFDDFEEWLPTKLIEDQEVFFEYLKLLLKTSEDLFEEKRNQLKEVFFTYHDANSSKRLIEHVFALNK